MVETEVARGRLSCRAVEGMIREIWSSHFGREVSPYDDFFELGGDSLAMIDMVAAARSRGLAVRSSTALRQPTPARLAEALTVGTDTVTELPPLHGPEQVADVPIVAEPIADGVGDPLYVIHSDSHRQLERDSIAAWGLDRPALGVRLPAGDSIAELADRCLAALPALESGLLLGFGQGAVLAYELASRVDAELVALVVPASGAVDDRERLHRRRLSTLAARFGLTGDETVEQIHARLRADGWYDDQVRPADLAALQRSWADLELSIGCYDYAPVAGRVLLFDDAATNHQKLRAAVEQLEIERFDYGIESPHAVLGDARLAERMRKALAA